MLDNLLDGIKGQVASAISEKAGIDMGQAEKTVPLAGESIKEGLMGAVTGGDTSGIMSMFSGGDMQSSSIFQTISSLFMSKLGGLGIGGGSATAISAMALPMILNKIKGAASNDAGEVNTSGLMSVLGGAGGAAGMLGGLAGGGALGSAIGAMTGGADAAKDAGGGMLGGLMGKVSGGADAVKNAGGGAMDAVKGGAGDATAAAGDAAEGAGDLVDGLKDKAADALKDKLGGIGKLFG